LVGEEVYLDGFILDFVQVFKSQVDLLLLLGIVKNEVPYDELDAVNEFVGALLQLFS
jgi:hypothetical protein